MSNQATENPPLPATVQLGAIRYRVQETADQTIVFTEAYPIYGFGCRFMFTRSRVKESSCGMSDIWWANVGGMGQMDGGNFSASNFARAFDFARLWRGENFTPWAPREAYEQSSGLSVVEHKEQEERRREAIAKYRREREA